MFLDDRLQNMNEVGAFTANTKMNDLEKVITQIWGLSCYMWENDSYEEISELQELLTSVKDATKRWLPEIHDSIDDFISALPEIAGGNFDQEMPSFEKWWGRGLIYVALSKRSEAS